MFRLEFHNIGYIAFQQDAQLVDGIGGHVFSVLHGVVIRLGKAHFEQSVGRDSFFLHRPEQGFIADHNTTSIVKTIIFLGCGIAYLR